MQQFADHIAITDLVYELGVCLDEGRFDQMRDLVVEEATVRTPGGQAEGRDALIAQASRNHAPDQRFQHVITNVQVDIHDHVDDQDGDRADVRANLVVHVTMVDDPPAPGAPAPAPRASIGEVYRFTVVRTADGWRFASIETIPLWVSGTLPPPPPRPAG